MSKFVARRAKNTYFPLVKKMHHRLIGLHERILHLGTNLIHLLPSQFSDEEGNTFEEGNITTLLEIRWVCIIYGYSDLQHKTFSILNFFKYRSSGSTVHSVEMRHMPGVQRHGTYLWRFRCISCHHERFCVYCGSAFKVLSIHCVSELPLKTNV